MRLSFVGAAFTLLGLFLGLAGGQTCPTAIAENNRIDCNVRPNTQSVCQGAGCVWCPNVGPTIAKCFLNTTNSHYVVHHAAQKCQSTTDCLVAINCHPDILTYQPSQASCESRGCLWLGVRAVSDQPRCVYYNNKLVNASGTDLPTLVNNKLCTNCSVCTVKTNCLPNEVSYRVTEKRCVREGCLWCAAESKCYVGGNSGLHTLSTLCHYCDDCPPHAYMKVGGSQASCEARGAQWCPNRQKAPDDRRCVTHTTLPGGGKCSAELVGRENCESCSNCVVPVSCKNETVETQATCESKNCLWCPNATDDKPDCRYKHNDVVCDKASNCNLHFPRFQKIVFKLKSHQRPHLLMLMKVLCITQMGVWNSASTDKCLSPSSYAVAPITRLVNKIP